MRSFPVRKLTRWFLFCLFFQSYENHLKLPLADCVQWIWMEEGGTLVSTVDSQQGGPGFEPSVEFPYVYAGCLWVPRLQCDVQRHSWDLVNWRI